MHVFLYIILVAVEGVVVYMIFRDWQQERRRKQSGALNVNWPKRSSASAN